MLSRLEERYPIGDPAFQALETLGLAGTLVAVLIAPCLGQESEIDQGPFLGNAGDNSAEHQSKECDPDTESTPIESEEHISISDQCITDENAISPVDFTVATSMKETGDASVNQAGAGGSFRNTGPANPDTDRTGFANGQVIAPPAGFNPGTTHIANSADSGARGSLSPQTAFNVTPGDPPMNSLGPASPRMSVSVIASVGTTDPPGMTTLSIPGPELGSNLAGVVENGDGAADTASPTTWDGGYADIVAYEDLWWFNGETPNYYATQTYLVAASFAPVPGTGQPFHWEITSGSDKVTFGNGQSSITLIDDNTVQVVAIAASAPAGTLQRDISISLTVNGLPVGTIQSAVRQPYKLVSTSNSDVPISSGASNGYSSLLHYEIKDQFGATLPMGIAVNEKWVSVETSDYAGEDWPRPAVSPGFVDPADLVDDITVVNPANNLTPTTQRPGNPTLGNEKVDHWGQEWYVGSLFTGAGVRVQTDTLQRYRDHARHENIVSPAP